MEYLLNSEQMKAVDQYSIHKIGIPSVVLMERAAYTVSELVKARAFVAYAGMNEWVDSAAIREVRKPKILCMSGRGNNGADGLAVARHLMQAGCQVDVMCLGDDQAASTDEYKIQRNILFNMDANIIECVQQEEYDYIVDAIFGVGLSRTVEGEYAKAIELVNGIKKNHPSTVIVSVDIPSGINSTDGSVMGTAVKADCTVTFGYKKLGMMLNPGAEYTGEIITADIGFAEVSVSELGGDYVAYTYALEDVKNVPKRGDNINKGDCGKVLVVAGSADMGGAAAMSAAGAYRSGAGLVKVFTHSNNRELLLKYVPEAVALTYGSELTEQDKDSLKNACKWADCVVVGPGLSQSEDAKAILDTVIESTDNTCIIVDADGLNLIASDRTHYDKLLKTRPHNTVIITPHMGEMSRLTGASIEELKRRPIESARGLAGTMNCACVLKDAKTVVTDSSNVYVNTTGNGGMATAGAGDVLTGVLAGMLTAGFGNVMDATTMAVNIHGCAGDMCKECKGSRSMKAWDIVESLPRIYKYSEV